MQRAGKALRFYSYLKASTGFLLAVLRVFPRVIRLWNTITMPMLQAKIHQETGTRTAKSLSHVLR
jgi:alpha-D-ribose 1-methylphosphonate 5-triphosphate synthase subunit PhnL